MIIPSIDLQDGQTVQLIGGKKKALEAGDPQPIAERFGRVGEIAVIDLDAAMGKGRQDALITPLLRTARCRVGGGIRDVEAAIRWLDAGACKVILGTAAKPAILEKLPRERVIAALDAVHGEIVVEGWQKKTGERVEQQIEALRPYVGGFLITFVEREGQMVGMDLAQVARLKDAAGDAELTVAGGVARAEEIGALDAMGVDAQVGMALYTGAFDLADALASCLRSDRPDGLWPTVITDPLGVALGLAYSDLESLRVALAQGVGAYASRKRGLWIKGAVSGATQRLQRVDLDCDRDTLRFVVEQTPPGFCHKDRWDCWGEAWGLRALQSTLAARLQDAPAGSYTRRLLEDPTLLTAKLREEAQELSEAVGKEATAAEAADVLYFTMVAAMRAGVGLEEISAEMDRRARKITRRPGDAKPKEGE
jgi:phosphoribosyl-ATP pyrophosphohydrolase